MSENCPLSLLQSAGPTAPAPAVTAEASRAMYRRVLAGWAADLLRLRALGADVPATRSVQVPAIVRPGLRLAGAGVGTPIAEQPAVPRWRGLAA